MRSLLTEAATGDRAIPNPAQQLGDVLLRLRNQFIDAEVMALIHRANQPDTDEATRVQLLREQQQLRQAKRQPLPAPPS